ncbi:MAG TPA: energy transducer TonB [Phenylobacterium sp.]|nr:energy transducer TonB [Phenylobacterium sp.]
MSRALAASLALAALCAGPAMAQSGLVTATAWTAAPTAADMAAVYPAKAKAEGIGGGVELACTTTASGGLKDCDVLVETPRGYGFGSAARTLTRAMKVAGVPGGTEVRVPMSFSSDLAKGGVATIKTPLWAALPSVQELQTAVPKTEGGPNEVRVTLVCDVQAGGSLSGCVVDREEPAGQGFGAAILAVGTKFKVNLMSGEGMPAVGAKVRVPVRIDLKPVQQATK